MYLSLSLYIYIYKSPQVTCVCKVARGSFNPPPEASPARRPRSSSRRIIMTRIIMIQTVMMIMITIIIIIIMVALRIIHTTSKYNSIMISLVLLLLLFTVMNIMFSMIVVIWPGCLPVRPISITRLDFRGFDSSISLTVRGEVLMSKGNIPETLSQQILAGIHNLSREIGRTRHQSCTSKGIRRYGILFVRSSCVSTLRPVVPCPYLCTSEGRPLE